MGVQYNGKSPSKLWYVWQNTKAMLQTPFNFTTRKDAGRFGKDAGIVLGTGVAANFILGAPLVMAAPLLPWIIGAAAITVIFKFGRSGWEKYKGLKETAFVSNYVRGQENKWYERKKNGNVLTRFKKSISDKLAKIPLGLIKAAKWAGLTGAVAGLGGATVGLLGQFGVVPALAPVMTSVVATGAAIGLGATAAVGIAIGAAVLAIPAGIGIFIASRNAVSTRTAGEKSSFAFKRTNETGTPIEQGRVFEGKSQSFDFNDNSAKPANDDNGLAEARRKAAEARKANKDRRDNTNKF